MSDENVSGSGTLADRKGDEGLSSVVRRQQITNRKGARSASSINGTRVKTAKAQVKSRCPKYTRPTFRTDRLDVFMIHPEGFHGSTRLCFFGLIRDSWWCDASDFRSTATILLHPDRAYVFYVVSSTLYRREGYAFEMLEGIARYLKRPLWAHGETRAGWHLCKSLEKAGLLWEDHRASDGKATEA
jgi:hypothetical protein